MKLDVLRLSRLKSIGVIMLIAIISMSIIGCNGEISVETSKQEETIINEEKLESVVYENPVYQSTKVVDKPETDRVEKEKRYSLEGTTKQDSDGNVIIINTSDILVLVNKERLLPHDYVPTDLVEPNVNFSFEEKLPKRQMRKEAAEALEALFAEAEKDNIELFAISGYRSYERQEAIFAYHSSQKGEVEANKVSAYPGQSEHQTGLAMDVSSRNAGLMLSEEFGDTIEGKWLVEVAHKFGFIIRYPKEKVDVTGYSYEPWHIRYVGQAAAKEIYEKNITLEEYFLQ